MITNALMGCRAISTELDIEEIGSDKILGKIVGFLERTGDLIILSEDGVVKHCDYRYIRIHPDDLSIVFRELKPEPLNQFSILDFGESNGKF